MVGVLLEHKTLDPEIERLFAENNQGDEAHCEEEAGPEDATQSHSGRP